MGQAKYIIIMMMMLKKKEKIAMNIRKKENKQK